MRHSIVVSLFLSLLAVNSFSQKTTDKPKPPASQASDSVKRHLPIEYAADLTPVVAAKECGASWNALRMAETA